MTSSTAGERLHHLDAVRAFALLLGVFFHASLSFVPFPIGWAVMDLSTSPLILGFVVVSHSFRMALFFMIAGFFSRMTFHRKGIRDFAQSRALRLAVPFVVGWFVLYPLILSGWVMGSASMRGELDIWGGLLEGYKAFSQLPGGLFVFTHLWFLYYLILITVLVLSLRGLLSLNVTLLEKLRSGLDKLITWTAGWQLGLAVPALLSVPILLNMPGWGVDTPDKSLIPQVPILLMYGSSFAFGWLLHRIPGNLVKLSRLTVSRTVIAIGACIASILLAKVQGDPSHPQFDLARTAFTFAYAFMMWSLIFLSIGVFQKLIQQHRPVVRYIADASYWIYLLHLPVVVWLQVAVSEWSLSWILKLPLTFLVAVGICLLSYDLFVRSTLIGRVLNGRRRERALF